MARQTINVGAAAGDGSGDPLRTAMQKANANFAEIYTSPTEALATLTITAGNASAAVDLATASSYAVVLNNNWSPALTRTGGFEAGRTYSVTIYVTQGSGGNRTITWPSSVRWSEGAAPTLSTAAGTEDIIVLTTRNQGSTWYGFLAGKAMA